MGPGSGEKPLRVWLVGWRTGGQKWYDDLYGGLGSGFKIARVRGTEQKARARLQASDPIYRTADASASHGKQTLQALLWPHVCRSMACPDRRSSGCA